MDSTESGFRAAVGILSRKGSQWPRHLRASFGYSGVPLSAYRQDCNFEKCLTFLLLQRADDGWKQGICAAHGFTSSHGKGQDNGIEVQVDY